MVPNVRSPAPFSPCTVHVSTQYRQYGLHPFATRSSTGPSFTGPSSRGPARRSPTHPGPAPARPLAPWGDRCLFRRGGRVAAASASGRRGAAGRPSVSAAIVSLIALNDNDRCVLAPAIFGRRGYAAPLGPRSARCPSPPVTVSAAPSRSLPAPLPLLSHLAAALWSKRLRAARGESVSARRAIVSPVAAAPIPANLRPRRAAPAAPRSGRARHGAHAAQRGKATRTLAHTEAGGFGRQQLRAWIGKTEGMRRVSSRSRAATSRWRTLVAYFLRCRPTGS